MRNIILLIGLTFIVGCSRYSEDIDFDDLPSNPTEVVTDLPVINIIVGQGKFDAMMDNYESEIEVDARLNLYRNQKLVIDDEKIEIEIKGNYSTRFDLKSLGVKFDDKYNNSNRDLINPRKILPYHNIDKIKSFRLRNSGNDFRFTMLKDRSFTDLAINSGLDFDLTYCEPSLVYINDEFYGLLNIRTESNAHGVSGLYGASKDDITLAKVTTHELVYKNGDFDRIGKFVNAIHLKNINYIRDELDVDNFIDYMIFESYAGNSDWPHNNAKFYAINNSKFRFILFDLDNVAWLKLETDPLTLIEDESNDNILSDLFAVLYDDPSFKIEFWDRYKTFLADDRIAFQAFKTIVAENKDEIINEMPFQIAKHDSPETMLEWNIEIDKLLNFHKERDEVVRSYVDSK